MGNCATSPETSVEYEKYLASEREISLESDISPYNAQDPSAPLNQEELHLMNNENKEIRFLVKIDRIKVRNIGNYSNVFCKFKFADKIPMKTHILSSTGSYWRSQFNFDYIAQEGLKSLREKQLEIELWAMNQQKESEACLGKASLPLIRIAEGPFHIDYQLLNNKKAPCGRIAFNCTMEQQCVWGVKFLKTQIKLKDSSEININDGNLWSIVVSKANQDSEDKYYSVDTSIPVITDQLDDLDAEKKHQLITLTWQESDLFEVSSSCTFREFVREPLKFQLRNSKSSMNPHYVIYGECWISLEKAYSLYIRHLDRAAEIRHHLWWNGVNVGEVSVFYQFTELCMVQQMVSGVNSEKGVSAGSTVILSDYSKSLFRRDIQEVPPQINEITRLYKSFLDLKTSSAHNDKEQVDVLERIIGYLRNSDKDSMVSYIYQSETSLFRAQCILLDILDGLASMLWDLSYTVKNVVFEVIFRLLKRSELSDLSLLGFDPARKEKPRKEEIELACNLRSVLLHILRDVLQRINEKGISQRLSVYCSRIISICMFCIPEFGDEVANTLWDPAIIKNMNHSASNSPTTPPTTLSHEFAGSTCSLFGANQSQQELNSISNEDVEEVIEHSSPATLEDMKIMEGGGFDSSFQITSQWLTTTMHICKITTPSLEHTDDSQDLLQSLLDWRPLTRAVLQYNQENNQFINDTDFFMNNTEWKRRIAIRGNLYYMIAEAWLQKVLSVLTNMHREIQWCQIRGYNELLLSFAYQLERTPLSEISDTMSKVMRTFLANESTLNLFVRILILKTRPYSLQEVSGVLELIDSLFCSYRRWMDRLERSRHPNASSIEMKLPATFCNYPFVDGIIELLRSDINQVLIKTMELLYHHWDLLRENQKHVFISVLLSSEMMKKLFLHWNVNVRQFYFYLTIYWLIQIPSNERKNKVDVYSFMKEFTKALSQRSYSLKVSNLQTLTFSVLTAEIKQNQCIMKKQDITSLIMSRVGCEEFCNNLLLFSLNDFKEFSMTVLNDFTNECCESLMEYLQLLALVYEVTDGDKVYYCCSPKVLAVNYDCFLFNPHVISMQSPFYQEQVLMARFFGFVRNVRRISMYKIDHTKEQFTKFQKSLHEAVTCCHNEVINKFNMQQMFIDKIVNLDMRAIYEQNLKYCEVMDAILKGNEYTIPEQLYPYAFNAILSYDDLFKKHERDQARNNNESPFLHWQTVFPTNLLSSWD